MNIITIDGPAAAGKSTIGYQIAQWLDFLFFDTGIMYRAVTWAMLERGNDAADIDTVGCIAESLPIEIDPPQSNQTDGRQATVRIGDQDITWAIRTPRVDQKVSAVAENAQVRLALTRQQRRIGLAYGSGSAEKLGVVMAGRDIGTVVLPEAPLKIYLSAPVEERARRRSQELMARGKQANFARVLAAMRQRDEIDSQRAIAPLRPADDAFLLETVGSSIEQIVSQIKDKWQAVVYAASVLGGSRTAPACAWLWEWYGDVIADVAFGCVFGDGDGLECAAWELWDSQAVDPWFDEDVWSAPVLD